MITIITDASEPLSWLNRGTTANRTQAITPKHWSLWVKHTVIHHTLPSSLDLRSASTVQTESWSVRPARSSRWLLRRTNFSHKRLRARFRCSCAWKKVYCSAKLHTVEDRAQCCVLSSVIVCVNYCAIVLSCALRNSPPICPFFTYGPLLLRMC